MAYIVSKGEVFTSSSKISSKTKVITPHSTKNKILSIKYFRKAKYMATCSPKYLRVYSTRSRDN
jgi:hypothetical protein